MTVRFFRATVHDMKTATRITIVIFALCASLCAQDFSSDEAVELRRIAQQIEAQRQQTSSSASFAESRRLLFKKIEREVSGLEALPKLTPDQMRWVLNAGVAGKKGDPFYRPFLPRLYALHYKHAQ